MKKGLRNVLVSVAVVSVASTATVMQSTNTSAINVARVVGVVLGGALGFTVVAPGLTIVAAVPGATVGGPAGAMVGGTAGYIAGFVWSAWLGARLCEWVCSSEKESSEKWERVEFRKIIEKSVDIEFGKIKNFSVKTVPELGRLTEKV